MAALEKLKMAAIASEMEGKKTLRTNFLIFLLNIFYIPINIIIFFVCIAFIIEWNHSKSGNRNAPPYYL